MSTPIKDAPNASDHVLLKVAIIAGIILLLVGLLAGGALLSATAFGQQFMSGLNWLFQLDSVQMWWFVTRSAGIVAYLLLWFSTVWGLAVPSKLLNPVLEAHFTFDFHEFLSLLSLGFVALHVTVLMLDRYLPYSIWQVLIPFLSPYRPLWVGIGVIACYIALLVTITFYLRTKIGMKNFRVIHYFSLLGYLGVTLHGLFAGTDSPLASMQWMYRGTGLVVIFLTVYWVVMKYQQSLAAKRVPAPVKQAPIRPASRRYK